MALNHPRPVVQLNLVSEGPSVVVGVAPQNHSSATVVPTVAVARKTPPELHAEHEGINVKDFFSKLHSHANAVSPPPDAEPTPSVSDRVNAALAGLKTSGTPSGSGTGSGAVAVTATASGSGSGGVGGGFSGNVRDLLLHEQATAAVSGPPPLPKSHSPSSTVKEGLPQPRSSTERKQTQQGVGAEKAASGAEHERPEKGRSPPAQVASASADPKGDRASTPPRRTPPPKKDPTTKQHAPPHQNKKFGAQGNKTEKATNSPKPRHSNSLAPASLAQLDPAVEATAGTVQGVQGADAIAILSTWSTNLKKGVPLSGATTTAQQPAPARSLKATTPSSPEKIEQPKAPRSPQIGALRSPGQPPQKRQNSNRDVVVDDEDDGVITLRY